MIGILDWGIGGLGCYRALLQAQPGMRVLYLSDAGFTPYGKVPAAQLAARVQVALTALCERGATHVIVACNAASTVLPALGVSGLAGPVRTRAGELQVTGVIEHGLSMLRSARVRRVAVIGGARTIRSHAYGRPLRERGVIVRERIAQPLSAHVERGDLGSAALERTLERILQPLRAEPNLLLACTHYVALTTSLSRRLPQARLFDPVESLVAFTAASWPRSDAPSDTFLTTGRRTSMRAAAQRAFGVRIAPSQLSGIRLR